MKSVVWPNKEKFLALIYGLLRYDPRNDDVKSLYLGERKMVDFIEETKSQLSSEPEKYVQLLIMVCVKMINTDKERKKQGKNYLKAKEVDRYISLIKSALDQPGVDVPSELAWFRTIILFCEWPETDCDTTEGQANKWKCCDRCKASKDCPGYKLWRNWSLRKFFLFSRTS